jgi:phosphatidylserine/phosphatidylglycerophosphate/cardiolipin synthase-like enzyme
MHDKFLVRVGEADHPEALLTGSANFTSEGLSAQANVLHIFESSELAALYLARKRLLDGDPTLKHTQSEQTGWSDKILAGDATVRVYFPPEDMKTRVSLDTIIDAIKAAKHSVLLCAFDPTDAALLDAVFEAGDRGLFMLGLVNKVPDHMPGGDPNRSDVAAEIAIIKRETDKHDFAGFGAFKSSDTPDGFAPERVLWPNEDPKIMVRVHHKFVVIDAEGDAPVVFSGSANFSSNSLHKNDENMLEITECPRLARMYFAEFIRLYEHYRARAAFSERQGGDKSKFILTPDNTWAKKYFVDGSPDAKARQAMAGSAGTATAVGRALRTASPRRPGDATHARSSR